MRLLSSTRDRERVGRYINRLQSMPRKCNIQTSIFSSVLIFLNGNRCLEHGVMKENERIEN